MAKLLNKIISTATETAYSTANNAIMLASSMNSQMKFVPTFKPNGALGSTGEYLLQRVKRVKGGDVATPNAKTTTNDLAALDAFSSIEWDTVEIVTGALRSIGVKLGINEEFDADNVGAVHAKGISDTIQHDAAKLKTKFYTEIIDNAGTAVATPLAFVNGEAAIFDAITAEARRLQFISDDFKDMTTASMQVIAMHPTVGDWVAKEIGTVFNQEAPIYHTGVMASFSLNGIPVLLEPELNRFVGHSGTGSVVGAVIVDVEAAAFNSDVVRKDVDIDLGLTRYVGNFQYDIIKLVDVDRVSKFEFASTDITPDIDA